MNVGELNVKDVPIPFTFSSYLISNALTDTNVRVSFTDSNNSNIGAVKYGNTVTSTNKRSSITINEIPEGTVKIKFGIRLQDGGHTEKTQLEEGTVATPYVPYNSLEVKVEGKNRFDCANSIIIYNNGSTKYERLENGLKLISSGKQYNMIYFLVDTVKNLKDKTLTLSSNISFSKDNQLTTLGLFYTDTNGGNRTTLFANNDVTSEGKYQVTGQVEEGENRYYVCIGLRPNVASNFASGDYTIYDNLQVEIGETATPYEPYKSQVVTFPLGEEKLMEGSYLADDGIHHKRKQVVLDGSDDENWTANGTNQGYAIVIDNVGGNTVGNVTSSVLCDKLTAVPQNTIYNGSAINGVASYGGTVSKLYVRFDSSITTGELLREKLAANPITVEYELAEPEIVPYTEEQQEAYNQLNDYELFDGVNYITMISTIPGTLSLAYYDKNNINLIKTEEDRIVGFVDNLEAVKQSIYHILSIERYAYLIYDDNYGVEFEQYIGKDFDYVNATIENTLQEALLYDLRILDVSVDNIEQIDINKVAINFTVDTIYGNLVMEVSIDV